MKPYPFLPQLVIALGLAALPVAVSAAPLNGADKAVGSMFTHAEIRPQLTYSLVSPRTEDSPRSDSATVAELADCTLLIVGQKFRASPDYGSDFGHADIASKLSRDGGKTWTDERRLIEFAPGDKNIQCPAICVLPNGELLIAALRVHETNSSSMCLFRSRAAPLAFAFTGRFAPSWAYP